MLEKTKTAVQVALGEPAIIDELWVPDPQPDQVTVKLFATGLCHSQLHQMHDPALARPLVLGHEATGVVTNKGKGVDHVAEGDHVIVTWMTRSPIRGSPTIMSPLRNHRGELVHGLLVYTWGEYVTVRGEHVIPVSRDYPMDVAAVVGCAVATGAGAVMHTARVRPGDSVAIFGVGGVGMSALCTAALLQAYPIIAVDVRDDKLELAKELGATDVVNALAVDPVEAVIDISEGGVDYAFDTTGVKETTGQVLPVTRSGGPGAENEGGMAVLVGNPSPELTIDPRHFVFHRRRYRGSTGATYPERDFPMFLRWHQEGKFPLDKLVSRRFRLDQINEAYAALEAGEILGRAIIEF